MGFLEKSILRRVWNLSVSDPVTYSPPQPPHSIFEVIYTGGGEEDEGPSWSVHPTWSKILLIRNAHSTSESANSHASKLAKMHVTGTTPSTESSWAGPQILAAQQLRRLAQASSIPEPSMLDRRNRTKQDGSDSPVIPSNFLRMNLRRDDWERGTRRTEVGCSRVIDVVRPEVDRKYHDTFGIALTLEGPSQVFQSFFIDTLLTSLFSLL